MMFAPFSVMTALRRFRRREDGGPTIAFVILFMPFMFLAILGFEMGLLMTRHAMLERGLDMAIREIRLNTGAEVDETIMKRKICNSAGILPDCMNNVRLEMRPIDFFQSGNQSNNSIPRRASCVNVNDPFEVPRNFQNGAANQVMVVRACGIFSPMLAQSVPFAGSDTGTRDGHYRLVATSAFVMEPV